MGEDMRGEVLRQAREHIGRITSYRDRELFIDDYIVDQEDGSIGYLTINLGEDEPTDLFYSEHKDTTLAKIVKAALSKKDAQARDIAVDEKLRYRVVEAKGLTPKKIFIGYPHYRQGEDESKRTFFFPRIAEMLKEFIRLSIIGKDDYVATDFGLNGDIDWERFVYDPTTGKATFDLDTRTNLCFRSQTPGTPDVTDKDDKTYRPHFIELCYRELMGAGVRVRLTGDKSVDRRVIALRDQYDFAVAGAKLGGDTSPTRTDDALYQFQLALLEQLGIRKTEIQKLKSNTTVVVLPTQELLSGIPQQAARGDYVVLMPEYIL